MSLRRRVRCSGKGGWEGSGFDDRKMDPTPQARNQAGQIGFAQIASLVFKFYYGVKDRRDRKLGGVWYVVELK
jgi:hypothetical protein